jgi:hypothetical protein
MSETPSDYGLHPSVLDDADTIVYGERRPEYPPPRMELVAAGAIREVLNLVAAAGPPDPHRDARLAALDRLMLKVIRLAYAYKRDTVVDVCGYAAMLEQVYREEPTNV